MLEKTMKSNKSIILLRSFSIVCAVAVVLSSMVFPALAVDYLNYRDFEVDVQVDGDNDIVKCVVPASFCTVGIRNEEWQVVAESKGSLSYDVSANQKYYIYFWPLPAILSLRNIPDTTEFYFMIRADVSSKAFSTPSCEMIYDYYEGDKSVKIVSTPYGEVSFPFTFAADGVISKPSSLVDGLGFSLWLRDFVPFSDSTLDLTAYDFQLTFTISSLYRMQELTGESNELLDEVNRQLEEQGKTMEDILNQQEQTNDKLDQLPGQIGDEMQDVIESEKEESKGEGNKFVDQILDALPDPSTDVLAAFKSLTDATAYTGTDAVLPIPAIVLPGIDGLLPETEIWEGTEFDFGDYLGFIPSSLLTLVQSLFTIAIVLFCVYELKGIISYCLTLRESKGG